MISWLPYPWQQRTAGVVKVRDYEVMVHKGLGSDKVLCGSKFGDFRSTENSLSFSKATWTQNAQMCDQISLIMELQDPAFQRGNFGFPCFQ